MLFKSLSRSGVLLLVCLLLSGACLPAQTLENSKDKALIQECYDLFDAADYGAAIKKTQAVAEQALAEENYPLYFKAILLLDSEYYSSNDGDGQQRILNRALKDAISFLSPNDPIFGKIYTQKGRYNLAHGELDSAIVNLKKGRDILEQSGDLKATLVQNYIHHFTYFMWTGDTYAANEILLSALEITRTDEEAAESEKEVLSFLGVTYYYLGDYDNAIAIGKQGVELVLSQPLATHLDSNAVVHGCNRLGVYCKEKADLEQALLYFRKAESFLRLMKNPPSRLMGAVLVNLGTCVTDPLESEQKKGYFQEALALMSGKSSRDEAKNYYIGLVNLAKYHKDQMELLSPADSAYLGHAESAQQALKEAFQIMEEWKFVFSSAYFSQARLNNVLGNHEEAILNCRAGLEILGKTKYGHEAGRFYRTMGDAYMELEVWDSALTCFQNAIKANTPGSDSNRFEPKSLEENPDLDANFITVNVYLALESKGECLYRMYKEKPDNQERLFQAHETFLLATRIIRQKRREFQVLNSNLSLSRWSFPLYEKAIRTSWELQELTGEERYGQEALGLSQQTKGLVLLAARQDAAAKGQGVIPAELLKLERQIRRDLIFYQGEIMDETWTKEKPDSTRLAIWETKVVDLETALADWESDVRKQYPQYEKEKSHLGQVSPFHAADTLLLPGEAMIEYFRGDDFLYSFVVTPGQLKTYRTPIPENFPFLIADFRRSLQDYNFIHDSTKACFAQYTRTAYAVYELCLAQQLADHPNLNKLLILPDGELHQVPFEALLTRKVDAGPVKYAGLPFLLQSFTTRYGHSADLLMEHHRRVRKPASRGCLALAPGYAGQELATAERMERGEIPTLRSGERPLAGARQEVQYISEVGISGTYLFGAAASENNFKAMAPAYSVLHLALHGKPNLRDPSRSNLIFTPAPADTIEDQVLYAYELSGVPLQADLTVLSACESGLGDFNLGEGVLSLGRSFMAAGAAAVVNTLWKVEDASSAELMRLFYQELAKGIPVNSALHQAKKSYLDAADSRTAHPYYWAGYVMSGAPEPLSLTQKAVRRPLLFLLIWVGMAGLLFGLFSLGRQRF